MAPLAALVAMDGSDTPPASGLLAVAPGTPASLRLTPTPAALEAKGRRLAPPRWRATEGRRSGAGSWPTPLGAGDRRRLGPLPNAPDHAGHVLYLILEEQQEGHLLMMQWLG